MMTKIHSNFKERATFFKTHAGVKPNESLTTFGRQFDMSFSAYGTFEMALSAFTYPFYHAKNCLFNLGSILNGGALLVGAIFNQPLTTGPQILSGIWNHLLAMLLDILNLATSTVLLITKTLSTLGYLGFNALNRFDDTKLNEYTLAPF